MISIRMIGLGLQDCTVKAFCSLGPPSLCAEMAAVMLGLLSVPLEGVIRNGEGA